MVFYYIDFNEQGRKGKNNSQDGSSGRVCGRQRIKLVTVIKLVMNYCI